MIKNQLIYFIIISLLLQSYSAVSQSDIRSVDQFLIKDGLSQNFVNTLMQGKLGYIWIGTQDGLNRYDGYQFKEYRKKLGNRNSLIANTIKYICKDGDSALWIATTGGLSRYSYASEQFNNFTHNPKDAYSLHTNSINYLMQDSSGILWIKSKEGLDSYDPRSNEFIYYRHPFDEFSYTSDYNNFTIVQESDQTLWTGTKDGLAKFDKESKQFSLYYPTGNRGDRGNEVFFVFIDKDKFFVGTKEGIYLFNSKTNKFSKTFHQLSQHTVTVIYRDQRGLLWVGTQNGLYYFTENDKLTAFEGRESYSSIRGVQVLSIMEDNTGLLWVSTDNGLFKIDLSSSVFQLYRGTGQKSPGFSSNQIFSIYAKNETSILLGTRKFGLNIYNRKTGKNKILTKSNSGLSDNNIHSISEDRNGNILLGTENGIYIFDKKTYAVEDFERLIPVNFGTMLHNNRITDIVHDTLNRYWIATFNGLFLIDNNNIFVFSEDKSDRFIPGDEVFNILETETGEIWIATQKGVGRYVPSDMTFKPYDTKSGLSHRAALVLHESESGDLWIGTKFGLNKYIPETDSFKFFTAETHGFSSDFIYSIREDKEQNLWLSTNKGIVKFNTKTKAVENFFVDDGLQSYEFNIGASYKVQRTGEIFFGGMNGVNSFFPDSTKTNTYAPQVLFTEIEIFGSKGVKRKSISGLKEIELAYDQRTFTLYFTMPEYTHPSKNSYRCKIEGFNNWQDIGTKNFYSVTQIPAGNYSILVKGFNSDNVETDIISKLEINILVPWWKTGLATVMYIVLIVVIVAGSIILYNRKLRKENKVLIRNQKTAKRIEHQKEMLTLRNKNISDSIHYARRIIQAMMPSPKFIKRLLPEAFILFMPKDIVSGDFYWMDKKDDIVFVAAVDCTGHGVPGAFMSIVGLNLLRDILSLGIENPAEILNRLSRNVADIFEKDDDEAMTVKDGMDLTICAIDRKNKQLQFAGAKNSLYLMRNNGLMEYKGDRVSVGPGEGSKYNFTNKVIPLEENDFIYMFSDGYVDQFGGPKNKKFKYRRFRSVLLNIYSHNVISQEKELKNTILRWKSGTEQVDDIMIIGIKPLTQQNS
ncbi:MAG: two-component regulator propeller domain-containing protein [Bacteroidota bacterium]|nr:two-component regulator propeller domain-containing protein [Bacteroidota bacterium]